MKNWFIVFVFLVRWCLPGCFAFAQDWKLVSQGNSGLTAAWVDKDAPDNIYIAGENQVCKTSDGGLNWEHLNIRGIGAVNVLFFDNKQRSLYLCTDKGLFSYSESNKAVKKIFRGRGFEQAGCTSLYIFKDIIYLGTSKGLFLSRDLGVTWARLDSELGNRVIVNIKAGRIKPELIYIASDSAVYKINALSRDMELIYRTASRENPEYEEAPEEDSADKEPGFIRDLALGVHNKTETLYLSTSRGIYASEDSGKNWQLMASEGLLSRLVDRLFVSEESVVFAVAGFNFLKYQDERWQDISSGLNNAKVSFVAEDNTGRIYAAADKGLFRLEGIIYRAAGGVDKILFYSRGEPAIKEVQEAAMDYAELNIDKIKKWRKQAQRKAWLPQVSVGANRDTTDLWHWESGSTAKSEDDNLLRGKDSIEWDVRLSWDLGEIIWNSDQASIDVRSRLLVQLRSDVIDEVTRVYFERLRLKSEIDNLNIEDSKKRFEKELKLQELTASLDALTGGYFCAKRSIKK